MHSGEYHHATTDHVREDDRMFHSRSDPEPRAAAVYQRTQLGEQVAIGQRHNLTAEGYRLLLLVNGVTRLSDLAPYASRTALPNVAEDLLRASMIEALGEGRT